MSDDEPIPSLAEALTEIRRLRALLAEYEARHASDMEYYRGLRERIEAREDEFVEFGRLRARIAELEGAPKHSLPDAASIKIFAEAVATMRAGTLEQPAPDEPATIEHNIPPNAPPHGEQPPIGHTIKWPSSIGNDDE